MMFNKKEWTPKIRYDGENVVVIGWNDNKTLDYLIGLGYTIMIWATDALHDGDSKIVLKKPITKNMEGNA